MIFRLDGKGRITFVNEVFLKQVGYSEAATYGRPLADFLHPDDLQKSRSVFTRVLAGETLHAFEYRLRSANGGWLNHQVTAWSVKDAAGRVVGIEGVSWDVTQLRVAEERLRRLNECFVSFTAKPEENIQKIVATAGDVLTAACALYSSIEGESLKVIAQWNAPADLQYEDRAEGHICRDVACAEKDEPMVLRELQSSRYAQSDPNVRRHGLRTYAGCAVKVGGRGVGTLCVVFKDDRLLSKEDLHFLQILSRALSVEEDRKRLAEETYLEKQVLQSAIENAPTGVVLLDRDSRVRMWNRYMEEVYRIPSSEVVGRKLEECFAGIHGEGILTWVDKVMETGEPHVEPEWQHTTRHIGKRTIELRIYPIHDRAGRVNGAGFTNLDVTEKKRGESERERLRQQLGAAQKMQSIATLAGGIAHDFNNLLATILLDVRLLEQHIPAKAEPHEVLSGMKDAAVQMTNLTQQLLAFARGGTYEPRPMSLNLAVERAVKFLERTFDRSLRLTLRLGPDLKNIEADPSQIEQVITNLLRNGIEALNGPGEITVSTRNTVAPDLPFLGTVLRPGDPAVGLRVQDTGCGMDEVTVARMFEPFFSTKFPGRGLGLAAVLGIVRNHGGIVEVASKPGLGTRVDIYLPPTDSSLPVELL